jgi:hypothetical protein
MLNNSDDQRLTFNFLCYHLLKDEEVEDWEKEFLKKQLISDGFISFELFDGIELPNITQKGINFMQKGGYRGNEKKEKLFEEVQTSTIKSNNRSKWACCNFIFNYNIDI